MDRQPVLKTGRSLKWDTVRTTTEMLPLGRSKTLLLPLPAACQSSNTRTNTHPCTADVCESSNEAFFVSMSQGLGCSSAEMRPTMLSLRFWSSRVRSCSLVTSHRTDILANTRTHTILAASFLLSLNLVELGALLTKILGMPGLSCTELQTISLMRVA